jgi:UDP-glucuronate 4-epimerase
MSKNLTTDKPIIITGAAGFIGFHVAQKLLSQGFCVIGMDNLNDYYDVSLKYARLRILEQFVNFSFFKHDIADKNAVFGVFTDIKPDYVIHLAAQAGVRYCIDNPDVYVQSNLVGHMNILEAIRSVKPKHTIYASSSSVYGNSTKTPFCVDDNTDNPVSLYAATKKSCEMLSYSYADMYGLYLTGLRFFTVYGEFGRPDMAYFKFTQKIMANQPIDIYNHGDMLRDFTYIDDITEGVIACLGIPIPQNVTPHRILNIGHNHPEKLLDMIEILENLLGKKAIKNYIPMQTGDVYATYANIDNLIDLTGVKPKTDLQTGLTLFIKWYKDYYQS